MKGVTEVRIFDAAGSLVYQNIMDASLLQKHRFQTHNYRQGAYYVQVTNENMVYSSDVMIVSGK
jgi:hypothetical protein